MLLYIRSLKIKLTLVIAAVLVGRLNAQIQPLAELKSHQGAVNSIALSPDGKLLASGSKDETIRIWDLEKNSVLSVFNTAGSSVKRVAFNRDGSKILTAGYMRVREINIHNGRKKRSKKIHTTFVEACMYSPDYNYIVTSSWRDNTLTVLTAAKLKKFIDLEQNVWTDMALFDSSGTKIFSAGHDALVKQFDFPSGKLVYTFAGHNDWVYDICLSPDQQSLYSASLDKSVKCWDATTGKNIYTLKGHEDGVICIAVSPDGTILATGGMDKRIFLWNTATKEKITDFEAHGNTVTDLIFGDNGSRLYSASMDAAIRVWDITSLIKN